MKFEPGMFPKRFTLLVIAGALAMSGAGVAQAAPQSNVVVIADMNYSKLPTKLKVGDTITWVNHDSVAHSMTARDRSFDVRVTPGQTATLTLQKAGTISFYCLYHTAMRGTLTVAP